MTISTHGKRTTAVSNELKQQNKITFVIMIFLCLLNISAADFELKALYDPKGWYKTSGASVSPGEEAESLKIKLQ